MILEEIRLKDFRCFFGESAIRFSTDEEKNVTIIYAENGVGKTTLLNALLWCFYGETTRRFEKREDIVNHDAKKAGRQTASVEVLFSQNGKDYIAKRYAGSGAFYSDDRSFQVARIDTGSQVSLPAPETFINTVIPREMAAHFLFDGEHAEIFLAEDNQGSIKKAVRDILGCTLIETAIDDLQTVSNQFRKQMPTTSASAQIASHSERIEALTLQIESANEHIGKLESAHASTRQQIHDIDEKLRNTAAAKELQRSRDRLAGQLIKVEKRQKDFGEEVFSWLGRNGRYIVSKKITEETFDFLDEKKNRGRIPSPYNEEFVKDVLTAEECICGAPLPVGSPEAQKVASLLLKAANQVMRDRVTKVRARLANLRTERLKAPAELATATKRLADANEEYGVIEAQLAEISQKLKGINLEDIAEREQRRDELDRDLVRINREIGALRTGIENAEREKAKLDNEINALAQQDVQTAIYARRRGLCEALKGKLEIQLIEEEKSAKSVLRASIKKILDATSRKALRLRMSESYDISLVNADGTAVAKSSGENQLLGLSFTAALVEFAKNRERAEDYKLLPGTIAPLVLDSPFGQLDPDYRQTTAEYIPEMAQQVVLLLSKSQGSPEVLAELSDRIGAEFVLIRHNREPAGAKKPETRMLKGKEYRTALFESNFDGTEVVEV
ncbi:MAG: sulfur modification protein DndD [Sphingomonadales bacterium]|jgi:DNA sulfur modification protein DndD|nr:sulfur modification protein DndD [Sphingomonadales bacterium]